MTLGQEGSDECERNVALMRATLHEVGLFTEPAKDKGPATAIGLLGMELDTVKLEIRLPAEKLARLTGLLHEWRGKKAGQEGVSQEGAAVPNRSNEPHLQRFKVGKNVPEETD